MAEGKKSRKMDRNRDWCKAYRARGQRERNKAKKILRHLLRYGMTDGKAVAVYNALPNIGKPKSHLNVANVPSAAKRIPPRVKMERRHPTPSLPSHRRTAGNMETA